MTGSVDTLPDLSELLTSQLREMIADPGRYTPEAVHAAARELASRAAVPRYYARLRPKGGDAPVVVVQRTKLDLGDWTRVLFSESRLRLLCGLMAVFQLLQLANLTYLTLEDAHRLQARLVPLSWVFYVGHGLALVGTLLLFLFFATLRRTLGIRGVA